MSWTLDKDGLKIADTSEILQEVQNVFTAAFPGINLDPSTPQGQIITSITEYIDNGQNDIATIASAFQNGGSGVWLDALVNQLYGITRKPAVNGSVTAIISGVTGTIIPSGFTAQSGDYKFKTVSNYTIAGNGSVYAELFAEDFGTFEIGAGTLTDILTPVAGVERITNPQGSISGTFAETDAELWARAQESVRFKSKSLFSGTLSQLLNLPDVRKVGGYENTDSATVTLKGTVMQPHSINITVKGGDIKTIAELILQNKNPGCYVGGNITYDVLEPISDQTYVMRFFRPTPTQLKAEISVIINELVSQDYAEQLQNQLINTIAGIKFGADIIPFNIGSQLSLENLKVADFKLGLINGTTGYTPISLAFTGEAVIVAENISVGIYAG